MPSLVRGALPIQQPPSAAIQAPTPLTPLPAPSTPAAAPPPLLGKSPRLCRHFVRGRCTWGNDCRFSHSMAPPAAVAPMWLGMQQAALQDQRNQILILALSQRYFVDQLRGVAVLQDGTEVPIGHAPTLSVDLQRRLECGAGLHGLVADTETFWPAMVQWHATGTTGCEGLDAELHAVTQHGAYAAHCMFASSPAGCQVPHCRYAHPATSPPSTRAPEVAVSTATLVLPPIARRPILNLQQAPVLSSTPPTLGAAVDDDDFLVESIGMGGMKWEDLCEVCEKTPCQCFSNRPNLWGKTAIML